MEFEIDERIFGYSWLAMTELHSTSEGSLPLAWSDPNIEYLFQMACKRHQYDFAKVAKSMQKAVEQHPSKFAALGKEADPSTFTETSCRLHWARIVRDVERKRVTSPAEKASASSSTRESPSRTSASPTRHAHPATSSATESVGLSSASREALELLKSNKNLLDAFNMEETMTSTKEAKKDGVNAVDDDGLPVNELLMTSSSLGAGRAAAHGEEEQQSTLKEIASTKQKLISIPVGAKPTLSVDLNRAFRPSAELTAAEVDECMAALAHELAVDAAESDAGDEEFNVVTDTGIEDLLEQMQRTMFDSIKKITGAEGSELVDVEDEVEYSSTSKKTIPKTNGDTYFDEKEGRSSVTSLPLPYDDSVEVEQQQVSCHIFGYEGSRVSMHKDVQRREAHFKHILASDELFRTDVTGSTPIKSPGVNTVRTTTAFGSMTSPISRPPTSTSTSASGAGSSLNGTTTSPQLGGRVVFAQLSPR